jgi:endonuclease/exonuclease/phosphatase family metal-dependent hydrolase
VTGRVAGLVAGLVGLVVLVVAAGVLAVQQVGEPTDPGASGPSPTTDAATDPTTGSPSSDPTTSEPTPSPCASDDAVRLRAMSLNLHGGRTKAGRPQLGRIATELRAWDADLVLLQEVDRGRERTGGVDQARWLARRLGFESVYGPTRRLRPGSTGNAILSRWPLADVAVDPLPHTRGAYRRALVRATVDVRGREVDVFVTHLDHVSPGLRRAQARAVAAAVRRSPRPVLLGGDLNAEPGMPATEALGRSGLVDGWDVVGRHDGLTVPAARPRRRIDYVLADESFVPVRSRVLISLVSDHRAVRTTYDLVPRDCD